MSSVTRHGILTSKETLTKTYLACKNALKLTNGNLRFQKIFRWITPDPVPQGRPRLKRPGKGASNAGGKGKGEEGKGKGRIIGTPLYVSTRAYETHNPGLLSCACWQRKIFRDENKFQACGMQTGGKLDYGCTAFQGSLKREW
jgi:hypothetical protein